MHDSHVLITKHLTMDILAVQLQEPRLGSAIYNTLIAQQKVKLYYLAI